MTKHRDIIADSRESLESRTVGLVKIIPLPVIHIYSNLDVKTYHQGVALQRTYRIY